jgi:hypothetical protein
MDAHLLMMIGDHKIAEDRAWAARYRLSLDADRARREVRQPSGLALDALLRTLAGVVGFGQLMLPALTQEPRAK